MKKLIALVLSMSILILPLYVQGKDSMSPVVKSSNPKKNATSISTTKALTVTFNEKILKGPSFSGIKLKDSKGKVHASAVSVSKSVLTVKLKSTLKQLSYYSLNIPAKSVKDSAGNVLKSSYYIKFKTVGKATPKPTLKPTPTLTPTPSLAPTPIITPTPSIPPRMLVGTNFWNKGWGYGWADYFESNVDWTTTTNPWKQGFIDDLKNAKYSVLRFMDWAPTNSSSVKTWSQRISKTANHYSSAGVAYEWQIDLCNKIGADMWITVPHLTIEDYEANATNNYWTQLADLVKEKLDPNLNVWVEYSNETWSGGTGFNQGDYTGNRGVQLGLATDSYSGKFAFHVYAALRLHKVFLDKFQDQTHRIKTVISGQAGSGWSNNRNWGTHVQCLALNNKTASGATNNNINPFNLKPEFYTVANYVGGNLNGSSANIRTEWTASVNAMKKSAQDVKNTFISDSVNYMKLIAYEGGQHILTNSDAFARNPLSYDMYKEWLQGASEYFDLTCHYTHSGKWASGGAWGAKDSTVQSLADAHKYRAIVDWNNEK